MLTDLSVRRRLAVRGEIRVNIITNRSRVLVERFFLVHERHGTAKDKTGRAKPARPMLLIRAYPL